MFSRVSQIARQTTRVAPRIARAYATEAEVKVPLELYGLDGTYATALYTAAAKENALPKTSAAVAKVQGLFAADPKAKAILTDPSLSAADHESVFKLVSENIGGDKVFLGFLETLAANNRLSLIDEVLENYKKLQNAGEGLVEATVTSAKPLDNSTFKKINAAVANSKFVGQGKQLKLTNIVDESIQGGLIVALDDHTVDLSIANKLSKYNQLLNESV